LFYSLLVVALARDTRAQMGRGPDGFATPPAAARQAIQQHLSMPPNGAGSPNRWALTQKLAVAEEDIDSFGYAVAISGDTVVVGAPGSNCWLRGCAGALLVFERDPEGGANWRYVQELALLGATFGMGRSVVIDGDTIATVAFSCCLGPYTLETILLIYERNGAGLQPWTLVQTHFLGRIDPHHAAMALAGDLLFVSEPIADYPIEPPQPGLVYVFARQGGGQNTWGPVARIASPTGIAEEYFGESLAYADHILAVGAPYASPWKPPTQAGHVYLFQGDEHDPANWQWVQTLEASDNASANDFGRSVALFDDLILVGASAVDNGAGMVSGAAYLYAPETNGGTSWLVQQKLVPPDNSIDGAGFGYWVLGQGETLVVGEKGIGRHARVHIYEPGPAGADLWGHLQTINLVQIGPVAGLDKEILVVGDPGSWRLEDFVSIYGRRDYQGYLPAVRR
ncbi:MAG: FG-GAP repeat protein, partial [Anaerolineales bacterium]|nr:FG-GAP repeat protein [Anaerolineales bacterium]